MSFVHEGDVNDIVLSVLVSDKQFLSGMDNNASVLYHTWRSTILYSKTDQLRTGKVSNPSKSKKITLLIPFLLFRATGTEGQLIFLGEKHYYGKRAK
jgi:hypothetical protein